MNFLLLPFSWAYGLIVSLRNAAYDAGVFAAKDGGVPVISVGNLTVGGTGKTPLVAYLAEVLLDRGLRVCVLSRGYRRRSRGVVVVSDGSEILAGPEAGGDEPVMLAHRLRKARVVVAEERWEGARHAVERLGAQVLLLDDGFQHRALKRDADIVVLDGRRDITREPLLPAGRRREPLAALDRADVIALSKIPPGNPTPAWVREVEAGRGKQAIRYHYRVDSVRAVCDDHEVLHSAVRGAKVFAFSGIADHAGFLQTLASLGVETFGAKEFEDHHSYTAADISFLREQAARVGAAQLVTTEKDAVKVRPLAAGLPVVYLRIGVEIDEGREALSALIVQWVREAPPRNV